MAMLEREHAFGEARSFFSSNGSPVSISTTSSCCSRQPKWVRRLIRVCHQEAMEAASPPARIRGPSEMAQKSALGAIEHDTIEFIAREARLLPTRQ